MVHSVSTSQKYDHAVVIGGSIAGLLAARVLTNHFRQVTIIEKDLGLDSQKPRPGVPQSLHVHVVLKRGQQILEELFPGITNELAQKGAVEVDWMQDWKILFADSFTPRFASEIVTRACTRKLLEGTIRQQLANSSSIQFLEGHQVTGLLTSSNPKAVRGVAIQSQKDTELEILADLVVNASGRNTQAPSWLEAIGYSAPQETVINAFLGYSSCWYQLSNSFSRDWKGTIIMAKAPANPRSGVLFPIEGNRFIVTLAGVGKDYPPTDYEGFIEFARSLRSPLIYEAIKNAQPISKISPYRRTENRLHHYEKLQRLPENFVTVGDAVCAFNPVYGQGMTTAALGAVCLDQCLQQNSSLTGFSIHFQHQLALVNKTPWLMATGEDFRWPTTVGGKPDRLSKFMHWYMNQIIELGTKQPDIHLAFFSVLHLIKSPTSFFHPSVLTPVLTHQVKKFFLKPATK